jgi:hypothetical protein
MSVATAASRAPTEEGSKAGGGERSLDYRHIYDPLVTSRNNSDPPLWLSYDTPLRELRPYVEKCGTGTLALLLDSSRVAFTALTCGSWNCSTCRRTLAAQLLDRMRRGMESRVDWNRVFVTLTIDPSRYGARPIGRALWDASGNRTDDPTRAVRSSTLWAPPTAKQFDQVTTDMSAEWNRLNDRLRRKAQRSGKVQAHYFRVIELHRNVWPHYHVVIEHPEWTAASIEHQVAGWNLGSITDAGDISLDDAVGELAPYLVSTERKAGGHKAYQFAARALPKGFRLHSSSQGFLADPQVSEYPPEHVQPLSGHFRSHHEAVNAWGGDSRIVLHCPPPKDQPDTPHKPPAAALATGSQAVSYYLQQLELQQVQLTPEQVTLAKEDCRA